MQRRKLPLYQEPRQIPDVYRNNHFGRSALDHDSARALAQVAVHATAQRRSPHLALLADNPYRVAFLPMDLNQPVETSYREQILDEKYRIWCGSAVRLSEELVGCASAFRIPLVGGTVDDAVARGISEYEALFNGDSPEGLAELRITWMLLHEGARLAVETGVALSLAG